MAGFTPQSFQLLDQLARNNTRDWYEDHKDTLKKEVREPFAGMLGVATMLLEGSRYPLIGNEKTMFRQNRDVRFSKDKTLYKTNVSGMLTPSGTKSEMGGVVYAQIGRESGMLAAGFYQLGTADLNKVRDRMINDADTFGSLINDLDAMGYPLERDNALKTIPRGFKPHQDHPLADYLRLKSYTVRRYEPQDAWINGDIVERIVALAEIVGPLNSWIRNALTFEPS
ncbi:MAG: DUF2461 domain-containing protein [Sulfitobacter sp.]